MSASGERQLVLVVGVGRSGTSLLSGMLGHLGFHIPQPEVKADSTNPRGFGEPRWVVDFHTRLLRERRVTVNDARPAAWESMGATAEDAGVRGDLGEWLSGQLREADALVVKDPRTVWFLPLWMRCAAELGVTTSFVTMLRHPAEVVASARKSYGPALTTAGRTSAWMNVILQTEHATRGARRAFVRYEDLLAEWPPEIRRVGSLIGAPQLSSVDPAAHPDVDGFVDPALHRNRVAWDELGVPDRVRDMAEDVWDGIQALARPGGDTAAAASALDEARAAYVAAYGEAEAIAQSSVMAARSRPAARAAAQATAPPSLRVRLARRVPVRYRRRLRRAVSVLRSRS
jgi:hypothetical protein